MNFFERKPKKKPYSPEHQELLKRIGEVSENPREARKLHKALKEYGDGLPMSIRYPWLPVYISLAALLIQIISTLLRLS